MAKPKQWSPTSKQMSEYERLLKAYNKMRKHIAKAHKVITGGESSGRLPSLVNLQQERKMTMKQIRLTGRKIFNFKLKQLNRIVKGGYKAFYKDFKNQYLELYREYILDETPMGYNGIYYSKDQIDGRREESTKEAQFMEDYNRIVAMNPYVFAFLVKSGRMPAFKLLYNEFKSEFSFYESWGDEMHKAIKQAYRMDVKWAEQIVTGVTKKGMKAEREKYEKYAKTMGWRK